MTASHWLAVAFVVVLVAAMGGFYCGGKWALAALYAQQQVIATLRDGALEATARATAAEVHARHADDLHICAVTEAIRARALLAGDDAPIPLEWFPPLPTAPRRPRIEA